MYNKLGVDWASSTLAFLSIAFIPIPFVLYRVCAISRHHLQAEANHRVQYGEGLRMHHSKYARKDF